MRHHPTSDAVPSQPDLPFARKPKVDFKEPPQGLGTYGMYLFMASLTMLFAAGIWGYIYFRFNLGGMETNHPAPLGSMVIPSYLWYSTGSLLFLSVAAHRTVQAARNGGRQSLKIWMLITAALATGFLVMQTPGLIELYRQHTTYMAQFNGASAGNTRLYAMAVMLIGLHAAHILGGLVPLGIVLANTFKDVYHPLHYRPILNMALYWHFLDAVWLVLLGVLVFVG